MYILKSKIMKMQNVRSFKLLTIDQENTLLLSILRIKKKLIIIIII